MGKTIKSVLYLGILGVFLFVGTVSADTITGTGTTNQISKFTSTNTIGDSLLADNGTNITLNSGNFYLPMGSLVDATSAGALSFGTGTATTMTFGRSGQNMVVNSKLGIGVTPNTSALLQVNGDIVAKGPIVDVRAYGAKGDGVNDDTSAIQSAINALTSGGIVFFPAGNYLITSTLNINTSSITLQGSGSFGNADVGTTFNGSRITWNSGTASPMVSASAVSGASNQALKRTVISDLSLDCVAAASVGLSINSSHFGSFRNLYIKNCLTTAIDMNVVATLGEARDNTKNVFENISIRQIDGSGASGMGIRMDGDASANTSNNDFFDISILHWNNTAVKMINTDSNRMYGLVINRVGGGTGLGIELGGSNTFGLNSRGNVFFFTDPGPGGTTSRGTGLSFPADRNTFYYYSQENGSPLPVVEGNSTITYDTDNFWNKLLLAQGGAGLDVDSAGTLSIGVNTANAITIGKSGVTVTFPGTASWAKAATTSNCNSTASPASCSAAPNGSVAMATGGTTLVVNTTAVTANSQIIVMEDSSLGTRLGITCNTTTGRDYTISARTAGTSFTIKSSASPSGNKACLSYMIIN